MVLWPLADGQLFGYARMSPWLFDSEATLSIFTKIFVVLDAVLAVLLVALVVPVVMNADTYREKFKGEQSARIAAEKLAESRDADLKANDAVAKQREAELQSRIAELDNQLRERTGQLQDAQQQLLAANSANADVRSQLASLTAGLGQATQVNSALQEELKERREAMLKLQTRSIELSEEVRQKATAAETLGREIRLIKEQMADLESQNRELIVKLEKAGSTVKTVDAAPGAAMPGVIDLARESFDSRVLIRGLVTHVQKLGDDVYVAVNVGTNDQVKEGMRFIVHRGDQFLGDLVITKVDLNSAAGRVVLQKAEIVPNAEVLAGQL